MENDKVIFRSDTALGLYSLLQRRIFWRQQLTQLRVNSVVRAMAVNPELGTITVFIEVTNTHGASSVQNLVIVWPTGQLQEEEPLKLSVAESDTAESERIPPAVLVSTSRAPLVLVSRICSGKVLCWRLTAACSQLVSEAKLTDRGGHVAVSNDGKWVAVVDKGAGGQPEVVVWTFEAADSPPLRTPKRILG